MPPKMPRPKCDRLPVTQLEPLPVEDPTPPPGPGHLAPEPRETANEHRGFLLWAMMMPERRSYRAISRAIDVGDVTVRRWASKNRWLERVQVANADRLAWQEYLGRYAETYRLQGIALIQGSMDFPGPMTPLAVLRARLGADADAQAYAPESVARKVLEAAQEMSRQVMGDRIHDPAPEDGAELPEEVAVGGEPEASVEADPNPDPPPRRSLAHTKSKFPVVKPIKLPDPPTPKPDPKPDPQKEAREREARQREEEREHAADPVQRKNRVDDYRKLVAASLGVYARDLTQGKVKVTPKDAIVLIGLEQSLADAPQDGGAKGPQESVRVRSAREAGEDVLEAIAQDMEEQRVILDALRQKRDQDVAHLREELERKPKKRPA